MEDKLFGMISKMYGEMQEMKSEMRDLKENMATKQDIIRLENIADENHNKLQVIKGLK